MMNREEFEKFREDLIDDAFGVSDTKSEDYTKGNEDVLHNFKSVGERTNTHPLDVLMVYKLKHQDAINNFVKTRGQSESEPIRQRVIDDINYNVLLLALIDDLDIEENADLEGRESDKPKYMAEACDEDGEYQYKYISSESLAEAEGAAERWVSNYGYTLLNVVEKQKT